MDEEKITKETNTSLSLNNTNKHGIENNYKSEYLVESVIRTVVLLKDGSKYDYNMEEVIHT